MKNHPAACRFQSWPLCAAAILSFSWILACDGDDPANTPDSAISIAGVEPACSFDNTGCDAELVISFRVASRFADEELEFTLAVDHGADGSIDESLDPLTDLEGTFPDFSVTITAPLGDHQFEITMTDMDEMTYEESAPFSVLDCKAPTPTCINGLAIELQAQPPDTDADGDGDPDRAAMTVYASDFIASPATDCSEPVQFSIHRSGTSPDITQSSLVLSCEDIGTVIVEVYAWDSATNADGAPNSDFCESYILVQDSSGHCAD